MSALRDRVNAELERIREDNGGTLKQRAVVDFARDPTTALHAAFDRRHLWDDAAAADAARLTFAAELIRTYTIRLISVNRPPVRAMVSLMDDRKRPSGLPGYRGITDVLSDPALRDGLIQTALVDLRACQRRFRDLSELGDVWAAIDAATARHAPPHDQAGAAGLGTAP